MARWLAPLLIMLVAAPPASAHYVDLNQALRQDDVLTAGLALSGRPLSYKENGVLKGFEIEMARAVAEAHGLSLDLVQMPRARLADALAAGEVDMVNTLAADGAVADVATVPYLVVGDHMMVLKGNPFRIRNAQDLSGRVTSVTSGSSAERFAHALSRQMVDEGLAPMDVHSFPHQRHTHFPVSMGHAVAYFIPTVSAVAISGDPESRTRLVEGVFHPVREVGFGIRSGNTDLHHAVEHAVAAMVATGKYRRLRQDHGLPADVSPYR